VFRLLARQTQPRRFKIDSGLWGSNPRLIQRSRQTVQSHERMVAGAARPFEVVWARGSLIASPDLWRCRSLNRTAQHAFHPAVSIPDEPTVAFAGLSLPTKVGSSSKPDIGRDTGKLIVQAVQTRSFAASNPFPRTEAWQLAHANIETCGAGQRPCPRGLSSP